VTLLLPPGSAEVVNVAAPCERLAVPKAVVEPPLRKEKLTVPTPVEGVTVTANVTLAPIMMFVAEGETVIELVVREADHAVKSASASTEPRPVT